MVTRRTCSNWPKCKGKARRGHKRCARCFARDWKAAREREAARKPVGMREQLIEDSGLRFPEATLRWLDKLSWIELKGVVEDILELCRRDRTGLDPAMV